MRPIRVLSLLVLSGVSLTAQQATPPQPAHGVVQSADGTPVAGAMISGDFWKRCCPAEQELVKTASDGSFAFAHPTSYLRVSDDRFQPATIFVPPDDTEVRLILADAKKTDERIRTCSPKKRPKRVGNWFRFVLPHDTKIKRVLDTDTISYYVNFPKSDFRLHIWSGPTLGGEEVDERLMRDSLSFTERWIRSRDGSAVGIDATGISKDRKSWRWFGTLQDVATYSGVTDTTAQYFDEVIDGACLSLPITPTHQDSAKP